MIQKKVNGSFLRFYICIIGVTLGLHRSKLLRKLQLWNISYMLYFCYTHATMLINHAYDHYGSLQILG